MKHKGKTAGRQVRKTRAQALRASSSFDLQRLRDSIKPFRLHWFSRLRSTNDHAVLLRKQHKLFAPALVLTGCQTAGRGRGANTWWSGPGCLTVTFVLPVQEHIPAHQIPLIAGVAVRRALAEATGVDDIQLKWPNDLLHRQRKLAGLLCERTDRIDLIGLGVNVNIDLADVPKLLRNDATSLSAIAGMWVDLGSVLVSVAKNLHRALARRDEPPFSEVLKEYDRYHMLVGRKICVIPGAEEPPLRGTCAGLDAMGRLLLRNKAGLGRVLSGQVSLHDRTIY